MSLVMLLVAGDYACICHESTCAYMCYHIGLACMTFLNMLSLWLQIPTTKIPITKYIACSFNSVTLIHIYIYIVQQYLGNSGLFANSELSYCYTPALKSPLQCQIYAHIIFKIFVYSITYTMDSQQVQISERSLKQKRTSHFLRSHNANNSHNFCKNNEGNA